MLTGFPPFPQTGHLVYHRTLFFFFPFDKSMFYALLFIKKYQCFHVNWNTRLEIAKNIRILKPLSTRVVPVGMWSINKRFQVAFQFPNYFRMMIMHALHNNTYFILSSRVPHNDSNGKIQGPFGCWLRAHRYTLLLGSKDFSYLKMLCFSQISVHSLSSE